MSRIRAAGGWTEEETEQLFEEARKAGEQGRPVKSVFAQIAALTGRKPNSIRNYYYLKLKENSSLAKAAFVPFEEEEVEMLLRKMLTAQAQGRSVRSVASEMGDGDEKAMLRYQNKYRSTLRNNPEMVRKVLMQLRSEGAEAFDPFEKKMSDSKELAAALGRAGVDGNAIVSNLLKLSRKAVRQADSTRTAELEEKLARLTEINNRFLAMTRLERISAMGEYVFELRAALSGAEGK